MDRGVIRDHTVTAVKSLPTAAQSTQSFAEPSPQTVPVQPRPITGATVNTFFDIKKPMTQDVLAPTPSVVKQSLHNVTVQANTSSNPVVTHEPAILPVSTEEPAVEAKHNTNKPAKRNKKWILNVLAALIFIIGIFVAYDGWKANGDIKAQASALSQKKDDSDSPNEEPVKTTDGYAVAADLPRTITIPTIQVHARVLQLGVNADNSLAAPAGIFDAGWYSSSAKPGDTAGAMLIDGHVSGPTKHGIFYDLKKLKVGDEIVIERGDGKTTTFVVQKNETVKSQDVNMSKMLQSVDPAKLGLNLITCGGTFDVQSNSYLSRTLVYATQK